VTSFHEQFSGATVVVEVAVAELALAVDTAGMVVVKAVSIAVGSDVALTVGFENT